MLAAYDLDTIQDDAELSAITDFAAKLCGTPIAVVSIVTADRQRFVARTGLRATEAPLSQNFCAHAMRLADPLVVLDTLAEAHLADDVLVTGEPHIRFYVGVPLISIEGAPIGTLCVIDSEPHPDGLTPVQMEGLLVMASAVKRRLLQRRQDIAASRAIARRDTQLRRMIDSVPGVAWSAAPDGTFDYFNAQWREITGEAPPRTAREWGQFIHEADFPRALKHWVHCVEAVQPYESQWRIRRADGSYHWMLSRAEPFMEEDGRARWFGTLIDIDDAHREGENRELLTNELSHRIKNIFAVISSLVALRARTHTDVQAFAQDLSGVIKSLSLAHAYVRPVEGQTSDNLPGLLRDLLGPYDTGVAGRIRVAGDNVPISVKAATPMALIFHELATNSAKYGALASHDGQVQIETQWTGDRTTPVVIHWRETGRAATTLAFDTSGKEGFGSRLLRMAVEGQLGGLFERRFLPEGLEVDLQIPATRISG